MIHNFSMSKADFTTVYDTVKVLDPEKRAKIKGLNSERADVFSASLSAIHMVMERCKFQQITVSGSALRESLMFNHTVPSTLEKPIADVMGHSIYTMMNYYDINIPHAEHVTGLCVQLYKQLRVLHKLPRQYVKALRIAALLHDAGMRIKFYDHNRHTFYFIINSNLYGVTHRDIVLAAFIAQGHKGDDFQMAEWNKYKDILLEQDLVAVMKLSVILQIAESLDRSMSSIVKTLNCDVLGDSVIMKTEVDGDATLEIKDAMRIAPDFARAYRKNLEIL
jgi:exopolyphosphatase/guanosine-5'-triphosphate,3'-diphosphate pyrophosphatase